MRALTSTLLVAALFFGACNTDNADGPRETPASERATTTTSTPAATSPSPDFASSAQCDSPEGFSISYPSSWSTNSGAVVPECSQFSPDEFEVPEGTDERVAPITVFIDPVEFFRAASPDQETSQELSRATTVIDGRQAVRVQQESNGEGLYAQGVEQTLYMVDLNIGSDDTEPGTLFLTTVDVGDFDYATNVEVLDRMARSMTISAGDEPEGGLPVVARYEGGGGGFTLVAEPSGEQTCLRIPPEGEPYCLDAPSSDGIAPQMFPLVGPERVLGGLSGDQVFRVEAHQDGGSVMSVLPTRIEGAAVRGWSLAGDSRDVDELVWFDIEDNELGRRSVG